MGAVAVPRHLRVPRGTRVGLVGRGETGSHGEARGSKRARNIVRLRAKTRMGEKTSQINEKVLQEGELEIKALNVDGIRQDRKRKALGTYLSGLRPQPDVCIIG